MAITIALFSVVILVLVVGCLIYIKPHKPWARFLLALCIYHLLSEISMLIASKLGVHNHMIANTHVLLFGAGMIIILNSIWSRLLKKPFPRWLLISILFLFVIVWLFEGAVIHSFQKFNPFSQAFIFMINLILVIYLLNVSLFSIKSGSNFQADRYLIFAFLIHCFGAIVIDSFFNYYISLPMNVYIVVSYMGLVIGVMTNFLILLAVRCLVLNKKRFSL